MKNALPLLLAFALLGAAGCRPSHAAEPARSAPARATPFTDYRGQAPGKTHLIRAGDLPPRRTCAESVDNRPRLVPRPKDAWPQAPAGFKVQLYAERAVEAAPAFAPRRTATCSSPRARPARSACCAGSGPTGAPTQSETFARGLEAAVRHRVLPADRASRAGSTSPTRTRSCASRTRSGDLTARGPAETVVAELPGGGLLRGGGHWTRDIAFSLDGKKMFVSVGSRSNVDDTDDNAGRVPPRRHPRVRRRTAASGRVYASGIRNAVGIAVHPRTGELWASVNERDGSATTWSPTTSRSVSEGGFYGWPWFYIGGNQDPRHAGKHPELRAKVIVPDVLLQPHDASLQMLFYEGKQFPAAYRGDIFAAEHGSWNRAVRTGYEVVRVPMHGTDRATGEYEDFLTGFVTDGGRGLGPAGRRRGRGRRRAARHRRRRRTAIWRVSYQGP